MVKSERLIATIPADTWERLEALATTRFHGNRSLAVAWAVEMASLVLTAPATHERLFTSPAAALEAYVATAGMSDSA